MVSHEQRVLDTLEGVISSEEGIADKRVPNQTQLRRQ